MKKINWSIVNLVIVIILFIVTIPDAIDGMKFKKECETLYEKELLTAEDIEIGSTYRTSTVITAGEEGVDPPEKISFRKLYGIEPVGTYEINKDGGLEIEFTAGKAKVLILDESDQQRYYDELEASGSMSFEPGKTGKYEVYIFGNKSTVKVQLNTY